MKHNIFKNSFYYENLFYLTCSTNRLSKIIAQFVVLKNLKFLKDLMLNLGFSKAVLYLDF